jgi:hypothetical protein
MKMNLKSLIGIFVFFFLTSCSTHDVVTYSNFKKISAEYTNNSAGIPLIDVQKVVGSQPKLGKENKVNGILVAQVPGESVYYWINKDGSNMSVTVINGKVTGLTESGLN